MGGRKKKRSRFECHGAFYLWYFDEDHSRIRIYSEDKKLVVSYFTGDPWGKEAHLEVHGHSFPGIDKTEPRPVRLCVPSDVSDEMKKSMGALVNALLQWCLDPNHSIRYYRPHNTPDFSTNVSCE